MFRYIEKNLLIFYSGNCISNIIKNNKMKKAIRKYKEVPFIPVHKTLPKLCFIVSFKYFVCSFFKNFLYANSPNAGETPTNIPSGRLG